jgi:transcriptional regulator with XRE-family HTH domain
MADHQFRNGVSLAIRALRAERRWTQRELCRQTELSPAYLSELESGQKDASADVLERIATAFDFRMEEFLWVVLLGMLTGEVPSVTRRDAALKLMKHVLETDPQSRAQIEEFVQFQRWKQANRGKRSREQRVDTPAPERNEQVEPDFKEE